VEIQVQFTLTDWDRLRRLFLPEYLFFLEVADPAGIIGAALRENLGRNLGEGIRKQYAELLAR